MPSRNRSTGPGERRSAKGPLPCPWTEPAAHGDDDIGVETRTASPAAAASGPRVGLGSRACQPVDRAVAKQVLDPSSPRRKPEPAPAGHPASTRRPSPATAGRRLVKDSPAEVHGARHLEGEGSHGAQYIHLSGLQPLLHVAKGDEERGWKWRWRERTEDPPDDERPTLPDAPVDEEARQPHAGDQLEPERGAPAGRGERPASESRKSW